MSRLRELWQSGRAPNLNGFYRVVGESRFADVGGSMLTKLELGPALDDSYLADAMADGMEVFTRDEAELGSSGWIVCGAGVFGADGFVARLNEQRELIWVFAFTDSNPFLRVQVVRLRSTIANDLGYSLSIDLHDSYVLRA